MAHHDGCGRLKAVCMGMLAMSFLLVSVMILSVSHWQSGSALMLRALPNSTEGQRAECNLCNDSREELLNKIRFLQKQFDMVESSVGKMDELETDVRHVVEFIKSLPDYTAFIAKKGANQSAVRKNCNFSTVQGAWSDSWKWLNDGCEIDLPREHHMRCFSRLGKTVLVGDSQSFRLYHMLLQFIRSGAKCTVLRQGGRCGLVNAYFGMPPVPVLSRAQPKPSELEGPIAYGKSHPGCTDCSGCNAQLTRCPATPANLNSSSESIDLEYLPVEFARDVELQSPAANTTQEVVALYLSRAKPPPAMVLFNAGIHDNEAFRALNASEERYQELYRRNMAWFVDTLERNVPNSTLVFLTTTPYRPAAAGGTNAINARIGLMNAAAGEIMLGRGHRVLDVHPLLSGERGARLFSDLNHASAAGGAYYKAVVHLLARQICGN